MIPRDYITEWRSRAPWTFDHHVEQDLVISRALVELFSRAEIAAGLAFRGGTALHKLVLPQAARYSEDIDLVQTREGPIGALLDEIHAALDPWLGQPRWKHSQGRVTLVYRFDSEDSPPLPLRLKVEINTREHFSVLGLQTHRFPVASRWFTGTAELLTYPLDELLGTKMRALYQRKKGRDLFDLWLALETCKVSPERAVRCFTAYLAAEGEHVTRAMFEKNLAEKRADPGFRADMTPLLAHGRAWSFDEALARVSQAYLPWLSGDPWRGE